jgi:hypothetical protein
LRRYTEVVEFHSEGTAANDLHTWVDTAPVVLRADIVSNGKVRLSRRAPKVGRCRLTVSTPVLKAPMISALAT